MADYAFTLAKVADKGRAAAKKIVGKDDGTREIFAYDRVTHWLFRRREVAGHEGMARLLAALAQRTDIMLLMGAPTPGLDLARPQLRRWADPDPIRNTLLTTGRAWLPIDVDGYPVPPPLGRADHLADAARAVRDDALGDEFEGCTCVVAATSSTGLVDEETAKLRLFFLLDREYPLADLHRWAQGAQLVGLPVDPAVLQAGQPIYTARPIFRGRLGDPVPARLRAFVLAGQAERVAIDPHRYDRRIDEIEYHVEQTRLGCGGDWRRLLAETLAGPASFYLPLTRALGMAAHTPETETVIISHVAALIAERADQPRIRRYNRCWMLSTLRRFRHFDRLAHGAATDIRRRLFEEAGT